MHLVEVVESQKAMGGSVQIGLILASDTRSRPILDEMWLTLFRFEKAASRFLETSELTRLNRISEIPHGLSPQLKRVLLSATTCAEQSEGLYNPFVLPAVQRAGYLNSVLDKSKTYTFDTRRRRIVPADNLKIGDDWARIPYGTAIDLGGCGKGHIIDELASFAREEGAVGGWIEASGDIFAWGHDVDMQPITIAVQAASPTYENISITVPAEGMGIATSGTFARNGVEYAVHQHHIIDPRTGKSARSDLLLATVCAPTGLEADVLASAAIILGSQQAPDYLGRHCASDWVLQPKNQNEISNTRLLSGPHIMVSRQAVAHA